MKKLAYLLICIFLFTNCTSQENSKVFINQTKGRYLFNSNEVLEIYFEEGIMFAKWRGNNKIELLKVNDSAFYMREMNEKMLFVSQPNMHIELAEKTEHKGVKYHFEKLQEGEKTPAEYFKDKEYDKALASFKEIQAKDSLNKSISRWRLNRTGYNFIRDKKYDEAEEIFKINIALYPKSSNVYDSMGELYALKKDTIQAITYFKKALAINPENRSSKRFLKRLTKK